MSVFLRSKGPLLLSVAGVVLILAALFTFQAIREDQRIRALGNAASFSSSQVTSLGEILGIEPRSSSSGRSSGSSRSGTSANNPYEPAIIFATLGVLALGIGLTAHITRKEKETDSV